MKKIRINEKNRAAIEAALKAVNGNSTSHTYTNLDDIYGVVMRATQQLSTLPRIAKANAKGITFQSVSGGAVANSYGHSRNATCVQISINAAGDWWLTSVAPETIWNSSGTENLIISEKHLAEMHATILRKCTVMPEGNA